MSGRLKRILVVDDVRYIRILIRDALKEYPVRFDEAGDCEDARFLIMKNNYDLLIIDYNLPGKTGVDLVAEMRKTSRVGQVLMISAFIDKARVHEAAAVGIEHIIMKPLVMNEFRSKIIKMLQLVENHPQKIIPEIKKEDVPSPATPRGVFKEGAFTVTTNQP